MGGVKLDFIFSFLVVFQKNENIIYNLIMQFFNYLSLKFVNDIFKEHRLQVLPKEEIVKALIWVHIPISNIKRMFPDIYHDIKPEYLQN
jgi:hypothetical protein